MKNIKSHFVFNRSQQNGIFVLVGVIIVLQMIYWFADFSPGEKLENNAGDLVKLQRQIDSAKTVAALKDSVRIYPFNPNFITDYRGYMLGMSVEEIDRLHVYRAGNNWINTAEEFRKVTGVDDSLLKKISPFFQFPEWVNSGNRREQVPKSPVTVPAEKHDLNAATVEDLTAVKGIGEVLAGRIVNYRNKIGGFVDDLQLKDIYGISFEVRKEIQKNFTVKDKPAVQIFDINEAGVLELTTVPYINYELAREIVNYRLLHEKITSFEELAKIKEFPSEKIDRIALYLTLK